MCQTIERDQMSVRELENDEKFIQIYSIPPIE